jgi:hypothetical protein
LAAANLSTSAFCNQLTAAAAIWWLQLRSIGFASGTTATQVVLQQLVLVLVHLASAIAFALAAASAAFFLSFNRFSSNNALALAAFSNLVCASASAVFASAIAFSGCFQLILSEFQHLI